MCIEIDESSLKRQASLTITTSDLTALPVLISMSHDIKPVFHPCQINVSINTRLIMKDMNGVMRYSARHYVRLNNQIDANGAHNVIDFQMEDLVVVYRPYVLHTIFQIFISTCLHVLTMTFIHLDHLEALSEYFF